MPHRYRWLIVLIAAAGCEGLGSLGKPQVDNPVMPPPPPRVGTSESPRPQETYEDSARTSGTSRTQSDEGLVQASVQEPNGGPGGAFSGSQVVATVNGEPIFASDVLDRYANKLKQAQQQVPPSRYRQIRHKLLKRDLPAYVEREILLQALKRSLKPEQLENVKKQLKRPFQKRVAQLKQELGVNTRHELERELQKQGMTLAQLRDDFVNQQMAMEFLSAKAKASQEIGRNDLLRYYRNHSDDYETKARVRWQQIVISFAEHGGREQARRVLNKVVSELRDGAEFTEIARRYSNGPMAQEGGGWDWMERGSLANEEIEDALFEIPVGKISEVFDDGDSFRLVRPVERREAGRVPFERVQEEIRQKLKEESRREAMQKALDDLMAGATVTTIFDGTGQDRNDASLQ